MSDNKIKIHKNPDRNDGPVTNKINPNRITVGACSMLGQSCQCLHAMEEHGQFGDLGKPVGFPDANCKLIKPHTRSTATQLPLSCSVSPFTGGTFPFFYSIPFFHSPSTSKGPRHSWKLEKAYSFLAFPEHTQQTHFVVLPSIWASLSSHPSSCHHLYGHSGSVLPFGHRVPGGQGLDLIFQIRCSTPHRDILTATGDKLVVPCLFLELARSDGFAGGNPTQSGWQLM